MQELSQFKGIDVLKLDDRSPMGINATEFIWKPPKSPEHPHSEANDEEKLFLIYVNARAANMFS